MLASQLVSSTRPHLVHVYRLLTRPSRQSGDLIMIRIFFSRPRIVRTWSTLASCKGNLMKRILRLTGILFAESSYLRSVPYTRCLETQRFGRCYLRSTHDERIGMILAVFSIGTSVDIHFISSTSRGFCLLRLSAKGRFTDCRRGLFPQCRIPFSSSFFREVSNDSCDSFPAVPAKRQSPYVHLWGTLQLRQVSGIFRLLWGLLFCSALVKRDKTTASDRI